MWCLLLQAQEDALAHGAYSWMTPAIQLETDAGIKQCKLADLDRVFKAQNLMRKGTKWAAACILEAIRGHVNTDIYLHQLRQLFKAPFEASEGSQLKLERFQTVHSLLNDQLLPRTVKQTLSKRMTDMEDMVDGQFGSRFCGKLFHDNEFEILQDSIEAYTMHQMLAQMSSLANHEIIPPEFQLTEDAETAAARAGLEVRVEKLKAARQTIKELAGCDSSYVAAVTAATADSKLSRNGVHGSYRFIWPSDAFAVSAALDKPLAPSLTVPNEECPQWAVALAHNARLEVMLANSPQPDSPAQKTLRPRYLLNQPVTLQ